MFVTLMPCLYVLLCGPKIRNKDSCILYLVTDFMSKDTRIIHHKDKDRQITSGFMSFPTVSQSYQDDGQMIMKGCVQWNLFTVEKIFASSRA